MDPATLIGVLLGLVIIVVANVMEGGNPMSLLLLPPMLLVFGTTLMVTMAGGTIPDAKNARQARSRPPSPAKVRPAARRRARRSSRWPRRPAARACWPSRTRSRTSTTRSSSRASRWPSTAPTPRRCATSSRPRCTPPSAQGKHSAKFFADAGAYAPTIGIIGTVMGLVHVLENLAEARGARPPDRRRVHRDPVGRACRPT